MVLSRNRWSEHFKSRTSCFPKRRSLSSVRHLQWWRCSTGSAVLLRERVEQDSKTGDFHVFYFQLSYPYKLWVVRAQKNDIGDTQAAEMSFLQKVAGLLVIGWRAELLLLYTERRRLWWFGDLTRIPCVCPLGVLTMWSGLRWVTDGWMNYKDYTIMFETVWGFSYFRKFKCVIQLFWSFYSIMQNMRKKISGKSYNK